jgi:hypothetical protein
MAAVPSTPAPANGYANGVVNGSGVAAAGAALASVTGGSPAALTAALSSYFESMADVASKRLYSKPLPKALFQFTLKPAGSWLLDCRGPGAMVSIGTPPAGTEPDCTLTVAAADFVSMAGTGGASSSSSSASSVFSGPASKFRAIRLLTSGRLQHSGQPKLLFALMPFFEAVRTYHSAKLRNGGVPPAGAQTPARTAASSSFSWDTNGLDRKHSGRNGHTTGETGSRGSRGSAASVFIHPSKWAPDEVPNPPLRCVSARCALCACWT